MRALKTLKVRFSSEDQHVYSISCISSVAECDIDGGVKFADNNARFGYLEDVLGPIEVCEDQLWKNIVLCEEEWTRENTVVACRDLGYATAG